MHHNLALVLAGRENAEEAEGHFHEALANAPENPLYHLNFAAFLIARNNRAEAAGLCERALKLAPGNPQAARLLEECRGQSER